MAGIDPEADYVPSPPPPAVVRWWEENRGPLSVRCRVHGELAGFDASLSIGMLAPAWNIAVIEYHNRWERGWDETYDTPAFDGCDVMIEATSDPGGSDLLDVEQMWIVTEGAVRPWWPYELGPGALRSARGPLVDVVHHYFETRIHGNTQARCGVRSQRLFEAVESRDDRHVVTR